MLHVICVETYEKCNIPVEIRFLKIFVIYSLESTAVPVLTKLFEANISLPNI